MRSDEQLLPDDLQDGSNRSPLIGAAREDEPLSRPGSHEATVQSGSDMIVAPFAARPIRPGAGRTASREVMRPRRQATGPVVRIAAARATGFVRPLQYARGMRSNEHL